MDGRHEMDRGSRRASPVLMIVTPRKAQGLHNTRVSPYPAKLHNIYNYEQKPSIFLQWCVLAALKYLLSPSYC